MKFQLNKICFTTIALLLFSVFSFNNTFANDTDWEVYQSVNYGSQEQGSFDLLTTDDTITVENSEEKSSLQFQNEEVTSIHFGHIDKITEFQHGEDTYVLIEKRYAGSGSILSFSLFQILDEDVTMIYESEDIPRGLIEIDTESSKLVVYTPLYSQDDSFAKPSEFNVQYLAIESHTVIEDQAKAMAIEEYNSDVHEEQPFQAKSFSNPSASEINRLLTETALKYNIPPEVFKAIAWQESTWRQFENGEPLIGFDGRGLGIMQITYSKDFIDDNPEIERRLKEDINYNIETGAKILIDKWNWTGGTLPLPTVNDGSWETIDNWYFAIMAYNGRSIINDPNENTDSAYPPFQTHIYKHKRTNGLLDDIYEIPKNELDIYYDTGSTLMKFDEKLHYDTSTEIKTRHLYKSGDTVSTTDTLTLRNTPGGSQVGTIPKNTIITITGSYKYQNDNTNHFVWYPVNYNGQTGYVESSYLEDSSNTAHLYGPTMYATAALISQEGWSQSDTVVLVRGDDFTDALSGAPLAYKLDAPMLVTKTNELRHETKEEIERLGATEVIILGGHLAINDNVEDQLEGMGLEVDRINGSTRFDTARMIADRLGDSHDEAIVINYTAFADAMTIAPYAAREGIPILLTEKDNIPKQTKDILDEATTKSTIVVGGYLVISDKILDQMPDPTQMDGRTMFHTADMIIEKYNSGRNHAYVVTGNDFPDGLTASVLAAKNDESIILTDPNHLRDESKNSMNKFSRVTILGGPLAISDSVVEQIRNR